MILIVNITLWKNHVPLIFESRRTKFIKNLYNIKENCGADFLLLFSDITSNGDILVGL